MKRLTMLLLFLFSIQEANAQESSKVDSIFNLNNELVICKVVNISEFEIVYLFPGESFTNTISKKQIKKIRFGSGRVQNFSEQIIIKGEQDWEKVQITTLPNDIIGLTKKGEVKGKAMGTAMANMTKVKSRAEEQIKREAAKIGAHIIFIQTYVITDSQPGISFGKSNINGVAYSYN